MDSSSLNFMTCGELRDGFTKCQDDINKRILIIDIRRPDLYERSHLCLDSRHNISSIKTKMRVMNIDPDLINAPTAKKFMSLLSDADLNIFKKRRDATEVVLIDEHTDDMSEMLNPRSKVMRMINALTKYDVQPDDKIVVPIQILKGGFREWVLKYPHFTTDPSYKLYLENGYRNIEAPKPSPSSPPIYVQPQPPTPSAPIKETEIALAPQPAKAPPASREVLPPTVAKKSPSTITPPMRPTGAKPTTVKNAPGTAVPVNPTLSLRVPLPRSHSSPNVAQADGDELSHESHEIESQIEVMANNLAINDNRKGTDRTESVASNASSQVLSPTNPSSYQVCNNVYRNQNFSPPSQVFPKPRFDRNLKPSYNNEFVAAIRAQLNFGRSPEASGKAITGLQNLGNTCFMNSVIQCLAYIPTLISYFRSDAYYSHINFQSQEGTKGELAIEFGSLVEKLNDRRHRYIEPRSFRESVTKYIGFAGNEQQDSHEFLMMLFEKLHHDLNIHAKDKPRENGNSTGDECNINIPRATLGYQFWKKHLEMNKSLISDLFEGIFMSTLTCTFCKGQSNTFEVFNCLSLPIPSENRCHIRDCLSHFSNPERIDAAWECPRCKQKREADKKIVICKLPKILIIHLKRFSLDGRWRQKLQTTVDFPLTDLSVDCTNVLPQSAYGAAHKSSFNLFAVVNHYGHLDGGHYTAYCKLENQRWYTFDDSNVSDMRDADVCGQAAYILLYSAAC